ncbi:MAG: hypothetical protein WBM50_11980 [Acidimicrobiales bacterium]
MTEHQTRGIEAVHVVRSAVAEPELRQLKRLVPDTHFERLYRDGFRFYRTTMWHPLDREPENVFESIIVGLQAVADPPASVTGAEWWFSVLNTNKTPQIEFISEKDTTIMSKKRGYRRGCGSGGSKSGSSKSTRSGKSGSSS